MSNTGRKSGVFAIKQEQNAPDTDACFGHGKLVEVKYENEYLKSQMVGQSNLQLASDGHTHLKEIEVRGNSTRGPSEELQGQIETLNRELLVEKQIRNAAEEALKHLQEVYSKADAKVQEITARLAEAQQKMNQEMIARDQINAELDLTLNQLHERAKQHILEVPKDQGAQRANESSCFLFGNLQAQAQHQLSPIWPSSSSSSSLGDSSSDESEYEHGEPSNAVPNATLESEEPWAWLEDWISEESDDYPAMVALTELLRHAEKASKQIKDLESVSPYRGSNAIRHGRHGRAYPREMMRKMMREQAWNYFGMEVITGLLRSAEQLSVKMKRRQPKRKRAPVDKNRKNSPKRLAKDLQAPANGLRKS